MTNEPNDDDPEPGNGDVTTPQNPCLEQTRDPRGKPEVVHFWPDDAHEGDTCNCGSWYRYTDRIISA